MAVVAMPSPARPAARRAAGAGAALAANASRGVGEMLARDRGYQEGLPKKTLIDAFRVIEDEDLVGRYRRRMSSLLF